MTLSQRTMKAVGWTTGAKIAHDVFQLGLSIVLMRLLAPEAFGLIAMILVFTGFAMIFSEMGFSSALVQRQGLQEEHRSTIFWMNLGMAVVLGGVMFLAAPAIAKFYGEPLLRPMTEWIALCFVLHAPAMVPRALLQKELRFDLLAKIGIANLILSGTVAVVVAAMGGGVWSLVVQQLVSAGSGSALILALSGWRPRLLWSGTALRQLFGFGAGLTGFNLINYWARQADKLLIGKFMSSEALGLYSRAYTLMLLPLTQVIGVLAPVMFPALSSIQHDKERVKRAFLRVMQLLTFVTFPMMLGLAVVAEPFVLTLFGPRWVGVIPIIQILAFVGVPQTVCNPTGWIYKSQGRTDWLFYWGLGGSGFLVLSIVVGVILGSVETVALCYLAGNLIITLPCLAIPGRLIGMTLSDVWRCLRGNLLCAGVMALLVAGVAHLLPDGLASAWQLAIQVTVGVVSYALLAWLSRQGAWQEISKLVVQFAGRRAGASA